MNFTDEQTKVITHLKGHALVSAVAGSGKTEVLVQRVKFLITERSVDPDSILILMFNKSAQEVFISRLNNILEPDQVPAVLTFHALGLRIISIWHERNQLSFPEVIDDEHYWLELSKIACMHANVEEGMGLSVHIDQLRKYLNAIELLKNVDYPALNIDPKIFNWSDSFYQQMKIFFRHFESLREQRHIYGLNDLLHAAVRILRTNSIYADEWRDSLNYILVDEYQDSNSLQQWILERFAKESTEIMVVGDEDQCIYSWRAANPLFMISGFERSFPNTTRYNLSRTFRYGHAVALMANHVLQYNSARSDKLVVSALSDPGVINVCSGNVFSLSTIVPELTDSDVILVRAFQHADDVEWLFQLQNVSYRLEGSNLFPSRFGGKVLKVVLGCALDKKSIPTLNDSKAWIRWVDPECSSSWVDYVSELVSSIGIETGLRKALELPQLTERQRLHLIQMLIWNGRLHDASGHKDCLSAIARRMDDAWSRAVDDKSRTRVVPLVVSILEHLNLLGWTIQMVLDKLNDWSLNTNDGPLITSIHRSKGGGWDTVILPHLEKGFFPNIEDDGDYANMEEERRLFYVAITRAKKRLILTVPDDILRDSIWKTPSKLDTFVYDGPSSKFLVESIPVFSQEVADILCTEPTLNMDLTSVALRYERELYPNIRKSKGLFSKLLLPS